MKETEKYVHTFGNGQAEGNQTMKNLLGGKGSNLAEMNRVGIPVPPGFTLTTEVCTIYNRVGKEETVNLVESQVKDAVQFLEQSMGAEFGNIQNSEALLRRPPRRALSCRRHGPGVETQSPP